MRPNRLLLFIGTEEQLARASRDHGSSALTERELATRSFQGVRLQSESEAAQLQKTAQENGRLAGIYSKAIETPRILRPFLR